MNRLRCTAVLRERSKRCIAEKVKVWQINILALPMGIYFILGETLEIDPDTPEDIRKKLEEAFPKYRKALEEKRAEGYWDIY